MARRDHVEVPDHVSERSASQKTKFDWSKASHREKESFKTVLDEQLSKVSIPYNVTCCCNLKCNSEVCHVEADSYSESIFQPIEQAVLDTIPAKPPKNQKTN